ncbi:MAG: DNA-directed RNA polymerase subunit alpha C-terminal domain-containing protein [Cetobacterium sp.]
MSFEFNHEKIELHELPLTSRIIRIFHENEIVYFNQIFNLSLKDISNFKGLGDRSLDKILDCSSLIFYQHHPSINKLLESINLSTRREYYFYLNEILIVISKFLKETKYFKTKIIKNYCFDKSYRDINIIDFSDNPESEKVLEDILKNKKFQKEIYERPFIKNYLEQNSKK